MTPSQRDEWTQAEPASLPEPTYWPAALALGIVLLVWGPVTTWMISAVGLALSVLALAGWIGDVLREHREQEDHAHD